MISSGHAQDVSVGSPDGVLRDALVAVRDLATSAVDGDLRSVDDRALIDMLADLRRLRSCTAAVEAQVQVAFDSAQRADAIARGVAKRDAGKGVAGQIALARGVSSYRAANDLAVAKGLVAELPATLHKLTEGAVSEQAALSVARETVCLMPEDRAVVDERVAARVAGMSPRRAAGFTRAEAAKVDGESVARRIRQAQKDRRVTVRPAPDAMVYLSGLLPVKEGVASYAALSRHADTLRAAGDERSRGAIMADTLVARLTGQEEPEQIAVEIQLVMPATTLLATRPTGAGEASPAEPESAGPNSAEAESAGPGFADPGYAGPDPAGPDFAKAGSEQADTVHADSGEPCGWIDDHPIPSEIAREIALLGDDEAKRWIRRLFTDPVSGDVSIVDTKRRRFSGAMRRAIVARDRACRGCGAPIRHIDHITAYADGGATSMLNGQGLCERCNQAKALPGWRSSAFIIEGRHVTVTKTPTGHKYVSQPPPPIIEPPPRERIPLEERLRERLPVDRPRTELRLLTGGVDLMTPARPRRAQRRRQERREPRGRDPGEGSDAPPRNARQ